ncbi:GTPase IMAP member 4 [Podila minutissima]|uniref:GTPase IMAP member 4 n=1 Tax=Podila minutissima TaxID=64525 RepID=A0A9P5SVG7_9FUNG|nr:GTPase IMAP member 4 [Podila minutissima]
MTKEYKSPHLARLAHLEAALKDEDFKPSNSENVVVMGKTGAGKSSIISLLLNNDVGVGHGLYSHTTKTREFDLQLPAKYGDRQVKLIDTQGVLDTEISLTTVLESLINGLTVRFYHVNTIMLILECARFTKDTQDALTSLCRIFGLNDIERSKRLLVVVTKLEHLPAEEQHKILKTVIEHPFFENLGISKEYMQENTIQAFAGQSDGLNPILAPAYEQLRVESKERLLSMLAEKNSPMTVSNDFAQKLTNFLTSHIHVVSAVAEVALEAFLRLLLDWE